jgi:2-iminobutanoate/2-iminopropanoate deaminase
MAARVGNMVFTSHIPGEDPATGKLPESVAEQAKNCFTNLASVLEKAGAKPTDVGHVTVWMKNTEDRRVAVNEWLNPPWFEMFPDPNSRPARHTIYLDSIGNYGILLEAIAVVKE